MQSGPKPRIVLCDDHGLVLEGLRSVLKEDFDVVGLATNGQDLVEETQRLQPDAVVLDVLMPVLDGMEAARQIKSQDANVKLLFVSQKSDREYVRSRCESALLRI